MLNTFNLPSLVRTTLVVAAALTGLGMSVQPPTFDQLVEHAEMVFRAEVAALRSEWRGENATRRIVTLVTFRVERNLVGTSSSTVELEFLGGRVGEDELRVSGQVEFRIGDCEILFVRGNGRQICPLVHAMFGRFRVEENQGTLAVTRHDRVPLASVDEVALPLASPPVASALRAVKDAGLTVEAFETQILARARALRKVQP
jgi:hypothetical protein